jgi:putative nucleotidyltransferase with HDIG domain
MGEDISFALDMIEQANALQHSYVRLKKSLEQTTSALSFALEKRDPYTAGHQQRVADLALAIAIEMGLDEARLDCIRVSAILHDIGKIGVPTEILSKPTRLTEVEFNLIKLHSGIGYDILKDIDFPWPVASVVIQHHEKLDGSGYPQGLKGDAILTEAKILCVADVVEAMASHRPYRAALGIEKALEEIARNKGIHFEPAAVEACLHLFKEKGFAFKA